MAPIVNKPTFVRDARYLARLESRYTNVANALPLRRRDFGVSAIRIRRRCESSLIQQPERRQ